MHIERRVSLLLAIILLASAGGCSQNIPVNEIPRMMEMLITARLQGRKIPVLSLQYPKLNIITAYQIQKNLIEQRLAKDFKESIAGFKAGITSSQAMKRFSVSEPVAGVMSASGNVANNKQISRNFNGTIMMMLETEIAFFIGKTLDEPVSDIKTLKTYVSYIAPMIELPDLGFVDLKNLTAADIIAGNVGASGFITGEKQRIDSVLPNSITIRLYRDKQLVNQGKATDIMGNQWNALLWLVNRIVEQGYSIKPGQFMTTGAMGKMIAAKPGIYQAEFSTLGNITFEIK